jgi:hypothetical protein
MREATVAADFQTEVDAIQDLTRVVLATQGDFESKADAVRKLADLSVPPARIATLLAINQTHVHSVLTRARKKAKGTEILDGKREGEDGEGA